MEIELRSACFNRNSDDFKAQNPGISDDGQPRESGTSGIGNNLKWLESQWWPSTEIDGRPMNSNHSWHCHDDKFLIGISCEQSLRPVTHPVSSLRGTLHILWAVSEARYISRLWAVSEARYIAWLWAVSEARYISRLWAISEARYISRLWAVSEARYISRLWAV